MAVTIIPRVQGWAKSAVRFGERKRSARRPLPKYVCLPPEFELVQRQRCCDSAAAPAIL